MVAGPGDAPHCPAVVASGFVGHEDGDGGADAVVDAEAEGADNDYDLEGRKVDGAYPSGHDGRKCERSRLEGHLHGDRYAYRPDPVYVAERCARSGESPAIWTVVSFDGEARDDGYRAYHAGKECAYAGSHESHFGKSAVAEDQQVVADYVEEIGREYDPHRQVGVLDAVAPLGEYVEHGHGQHAGEVDQEVWAYERQQFFRLAETVEIEIYEGHQRHDRDGEHGVEHKGGACDGAYVAMSSAGI